MKKFVFDEGEFSFYRKDQLIESRGEIIQPNLYWGGGKISVFISHRHDDLEDLRGIIGFLEKNYNVKCYIDSRDPSLPKTTSGETARRIKGRIEGCKKFILLATEGAIDSKWCNWELGYGDAKKFKDHIAIFPLKKKGTSEFSYKGYEYLQIYPAIAYYSQGEKYKGGSPIAPGYYVREQSEDSSYITPLADWLNK